MPRAVIHYDEIGMVKYLADEGVELFVVDERAPDDRVYRTSPDPIPDGILEGPAGYRGDGSRSEAVIHRALRNSISQSHLREVSKED